MGAVPHLAGRTDQERITDAVRQRVIAVGAASATVPATAMPDPPAGQTDSIRRWDQQFESPSLQERVRCEPDFLDHGCGLVAPLRHLQRRAA